MTPKAYRLELERQRAAHRTWFWNSVLIDVLLQCDPAADINALMARIIDEYRAEAK